MRALAAWLEHRPWPGHDVFCRGQAAADAAIPVPDIPVPDIPVPDIIEFLWASLALFDDAAPAIATARDPPPPPVWHAIAAARERISRLLAAAPDEHPDGFPLAALLPSATMAPAITEAGGSKQPGWHGGGARPGPAPSSPAWNWRGNAA